jgi:type VI secretion system protein ImpA
MSIIDIETLLQPISAAHPAGENLEYDPAFAELERTARGKAEQRIGDAVAPGEPPDWNTVYSKSLELLARSKDLRLASHLLRALLHRHGFEGLSQGLLAIRGMLERYWAPIHPQLDPDEPNDPTIRVTALAVLWDQEMLAALRAAPLVRSRSFGQVGLREIAIASGEIPADPNRPALEMPAIEAAFQDAALPVLETTSQALKSASEHLGAIERQFAETVGVAGPDVSAMARLIRQAAQFLQPRLDARRAAENPGAEQGDAAAHANGATGSAALSGEIRSREEVVRALDKICSYYERHEPSSPLPLLLQRCKRLATMSFIEIVREMVPDGLSQVEVIAGKREES